MNIKRTLIYLGALSMLFLPFIPVYGATFLPASDDVASLRSESEGDVYAANDSIVITAPVRGDIFAAGNNIDISGSSDASIFAIGRNVSITGEVGDDIRTAGDILSIGSNVTHDVFAAGSRISILSNSHIHGDTYIAGERITISGTIHGDLRVTGDTIVIADGAVVMGNITSYSIEPTIEEGATVSGSITTVSPQESVGNAGRFFSSGMFIQSTVALSALALLLVFAAPLLVSRSKDVIEKSPVSSGAIGLLWMLLFLPVSLILIVSSIGMYIGLLLFTGTLSLLFLAVGCMVIEIGRKLYRFIAKQDGVVWHYAIIGAVITSLMFLLDFIGFIVLALAFFVALGAVLKTFWNFIQPNTL